MSIYTPASRQELLDYCLRELGEPVCEVNIDPDQLEDRFEEALQYYREFHHDASERIYLSAQITPSTMNLQSGNGNVFIVDDVITGANSSAVCTVQSLVSDNVISVKGVTGTFQVDETITSDKSNISGQLANVTPVVLGSFDNKYFDIDEKVLSITKCLQFNTTTSGGYMFDVQYQLMLNNMPTLTSLDIGYFVQLKTYLSMLNDILTGQKPIRYRRHTNKLYVDLDWKTVTIGNYIVVEAYAVLDPQQYTDIYNDMWLKAFTTALIKRQWGQNLKKFTGISLPGGVQLNGQVIFDEAIQEIEKLKQDCRDTFQIPIDFFAG